MTSGHVRIAPHNFFGLGFLGLALLLAGCSGGDGAISTTTVTAASTALSVEDDTANAGTDEETTNTLGSADGGQGATTTLAPTTSSVTTLPADPQAPRAVRFDPGASATVVSDAVVRGNRHTYTIDARAGQTMELSISSLEDNAVYDLLDPGGNLLESEVTGSQTLLLQDGVHSVVIGGTRGNASYELIIVIPPETTDPTIEDSDDEDGADDPTGVEAIRFESGASAATVSNSVVRAEVQIYTIDVSAGQFMSLSITSLEDNAQFAVIAPGGGLIVSESTSYEFDLAESGNYQLIVSSWRGNATYDLMVTVL